MKKYAGTKYNSMWDWSTWLLLGIVAICCIAPVFLDDDGYLPAIVCLVMLVFVVITFTSIYYRIDGSDLIVYTFFRPTAYPIEKIKSVKPTKSVFSSPATSLTHRMAITFTDRRVLRSMDPLIISPVRQDEFIAQLLAINPKIATEYPGCKPGNTEIAPENLSKD